VIIPEIQQKSIKIIGKWSYLGAAILALTQISISV